MIISVASGKGGTGKTTIAVNLALALQPGLPVQFLDCDVEEPNAHFFLKPRFEKTREIFTPIPVINENLCNFCGRCAEVCAYNALAVLKDTVLVFSELCHGCGACGLVCPEKAIQETGKRVGVIESGRAREILFVHGRLDIGQAMSPPLIRALKKKLDPSRTVVIDAPPGTSCPVIESIKRSEFCLLVTEPTPFGLHDLELAVGAAKKMEIPCGVVLNRAMLGNGDGPVRDFCASEGIPILMSIPFDRRIAEAYSRGQTMIDALPDYRTAFLGLYKNIRMLLS